MRKPLVAFSVVLLGVSVAACGSGSIRPPTTSKSGSAAAPRGGTTASAAAFFSVASPASVPAGPGCSRSALAGKLYEKGYLTIATDKPAYTPWFWVNNPSNGKGYESAVAYAVAHQLGFRNSEVRWVYEPFNDSYAPGPKKFDFDINEISYSRARAREVTFSISYFADRQALVVLKHSAIARRHSPAELRRYVYGDQVGTTSLAYIEDHIKPTQQVKVYGTLNDVKSALDTHQIDGFVTDTPTAQYISSQQVPGSETLGQFPSTGEHFGLLFQKGDPLVGCVDKALRNLTRNGTLHRLYKRFLSIYTAIPTIKP